MRELLEGLGFEVELRREGRVRFLAPKLPSEKGYAPTSLPAFFNPVSKPSRDVAVLFLRRFFHGRRVRACEPLAGTGVRSIRLVVESGVVDYVLANDISKNAYELIKRNTVLNGVEDVVEAANLDANELLAARGRGRPRFDYVDIDPAGSPARFMENGFRGCGRGGVLGATATDMSALAGAKPESCARKYDAMPLRGAPFSKEVALRVLAGFMVRTAARLGLAAKPILSFQRDHYARVFVRVEPGIERAKKLLKEIGWLSYCSECLAIHRSSLWNPPPTRCEFCGRSLSYAGPMWLGELTDRGLARGMLEEALKEPEVYKDVVKMLELMAEEDTNIIGYYPVNDVASRLGKSPVKPRRLMEALEGMGFKATPTHIHPGAVKTDAPPDALREAFEKAGSKG